MEPIWPTDTYSNNASFFLPPSSQSFRPNERSERQRRRMGSVEYADTEETTNMHRERPKSCGEQRRKYSSSFPLKSGRSWCTPLTWGM